MSKITPFITLDEVIANSATLIKNTDPRHRNILRQWSYLGERKLGWSGDQIQAKQVDVVDLAIKKPSNYAVGIDLALFDSTDKEYKYHFRGKGKRIHNERYFVGSSLDYLPSSLNEIGVSEDAYYFYLDSIADNISYANIEYYGYPEDSGGDLMFPEHHLLALMMFNRWMWRIRENENQSDISQANSDWLREQRAAKAKNKVPSMLEGKDIVRYHNSMIDKIWYDIF